MIKRDRDLIARTLNHLRPPRDSVETYEMWEKIAEHLADVVSTLAERKTRQEFRSLCHGISLPNE